MAIDNLVLVRKRIGDDKKSETETFPLTEDTVTLQLKYTNGGIFNIYDREKQSTPLVSGTDFNFDKEAGLVTLLYTPTNGNATVVYWYYAFTDDELAELINSYGVNGACAEAVRWLLADSARLHDYTRGATSESLSQIYKNLKDMLKDYDKLASTTTVDGESKSEVSVGKRIHNYYRTRRDVPFDLSRDDSLSQ